MGQVSVCQARRERAGWRQAFHHDFVGDFGRVIFVDARCEMRCIDIGSLEVGWEGERKRKGLPCLRLLGAFY